MQGRRWILRNQPKAHLTANLTTKFLLFFPTPHVSGGNAERETQSPGMAEERLGSSVIPKPAAQRRVRDLLRLPSGGTQTRGGADSSPSTGSGLE
jgi:hypothetical protein